MPRSSMLWVLGLAIGALVALGPVGARGEAGSPVAGAPAWRVVASGKTVGDLSAVAAVSGRDVWVVGAGRGDGRPLIAHWDGRALRRVPVLAGLGRGSLEAVRARNARDVWAVGYLGDLEGTTTALVVHWDGTSWKRSAAPLVYGGLRGVLPLAADDVWAVGHEGDAPLAMHFDGRRWSKVRLPRFTDAAELLAVDGLGAADVWAVGSVYAGATLHERYDVAFHWDGSSWRRDPRWTSDQSLCALDMLSSTRIYAVSDVGGEGSSDVLSWDGRAIRRVRSSGELTSIVAPSATNVWAGGATLVHWNGARWQVMRPAFLRDSSILGLSAASSKEIWGVGPGIVARFGAS